MNDELITAPPSRAEETNPIQELRDIDSLLGSNPSQLLLDLMKKLNATPDEITNVKRSVNQMGFNLAQVDMPILQMLAVQLLIAYSTETGRSVHGKLDSRSVATRGLFFTPDLWV